ncbi:MAG: PIN domain-containing protein [Bacteroidota bacterium]
MFLDADVLFAGAATANAQSASQVVLRLAEATVIEAVTSRQAVRECERNLEAKVPAAVGVFRRLVAAADVEVVEAPSPARVDAHDGKADAKDLPLLVAAIEAGCPLLVTFNARDYRPGDPAVEVVGPGALVQRVRARLAGLATPRPPDG